MDFLKIHKKEVMISMVSVSMILMYLNHLYSNKSSDKEYPFKKRKNERTSLYDKISQFLRPLFNHRSDKGMRRERIIETPSHKLTNIIKFQQIEENDGRELKDMIEIFDKTGQNLDKIDYKALNFKKFKGKKPKGKRKSRKAQYMHLREQRDKLKSIVQDLYTFNKSQSDKKNNDEGLLQIEN